MNVRAIFYYSTIFPKDCQAAISERKEKRAAPAILMRFSYFHLFPPRHAFGKEVLKEKFNLSNQQKIAKNSNGNSLYGRLDLTKKWYQEDNGSSQSEFIKKAICFYAGYVANEQNSNYLLNIVVSTLKGIVAESDNKQNRMLFKRSVEMAMMTNLTAASTDVDKIILQRLCGECANEFKRLNGSLSFEVALDW